jgi:hypothetical protein
MRGGPVSERTFRAVVAGVLVGALALAAVVVFVGLSSPSASPAPTAARTATARPPLIATATPTPTPRLVFGDVGVTPVGSVPRGGASGATLVLRFVETSIDAIPDAAGSLTVTLATAPAAGRHSRSRARPRSTRRARSAPRRGLRRGKRASDQHPGIRFAKHRADHHHRPWDPRDAGRRARADHGDARRLQRFPRRRCGECRPAFPRDGHCRAVGANPNRADRQDLRLRPPPPSPRGPARAGSGPPSRPSRSCRGSVRWRDFP